MNNAREVVAFHGIEFARKLREKIADIGSSLGVGQNRRCGDALAQCFAGDFVLSFENAHAQLSKRSVKRWRRSYARLPAALQKKVARGVTAAIGAEIAEMIDPPQPSLGETFEARLERGARPIACLAATLKEPT